MNRILRMATLADSSDLLNIYKPFVEETAISFEYRTRNAYDWSVESSVYLHKDFHGRGIGKKLYLELFKLLKEAGFYTVYAGITLPHPASHALYKSLGFEEIGVYKQVGFKNGSWHDTLWYQLILQNDTAPSPIKYGLTYK